MTASCNYPKVLDIWLAAKRPFLTQLRRVIKLPPFTSKCVSEVVLNSIVGKGGVESILELTLEPSEQKAIMESAAILKEAFAGL